MKMQLEEWQGWDAIGEAPSSFIKYVIDYRLGRPVPMLRVSDPYPMKLLRVAPILALLDELQRRGEDYDQPVAANRRYLGLQIGGPGMTLKSIGPSAARDREAVAIRKAGTFWT